MVDLLEIKLESILNNRKLVLDKIFTMGIFDELLRKLPPFLDYSKHIYPNKVTALVADARKSYFYLTNYMMRYFSPKSTTNQSTSPLVAQLAQISAISILA